MSDAIQQVHTLRRDGVALVLTQTADEMARIVHWGGDPGPTVPAAAFGLTGLPLLPMQHEGWAGRAAVTGDRAGRWPHLRLRPQAVNLTESTIDAIHVDDEAGVEIQWTLELTDQGVAKVRQSLRNRGEGVWTVGGLRCVLPIPDGATDRLDLTGRWALERVPQRGAFGFGVHSRQNWRGRTGHDSTTLLCVGSEGFANRAGEVWAVHVGWSGNHEHSAERLPDSVGALGGGELLDSGEVRLEPGETYETPWVYFAYSAAGLDGVRDRFHRLIRARETHPRTPRPVVLNTWEAVYFNHDLDKLKALADKAAEVGVERFVLDDGWFRHRRDDHAGLGDWYVDESIWPHGLNPLVDHVHSRGMQFGLWFEPEMVNPDSDLARAHPEWILAAPGRLPAELRQQHVLNVARPEVFDYLLERIDALVKQYRIDFIKWDHNRDLVEATTADARAGVHAQTLAVYRLLDELRTRHPNLEIESCSSGGARVDLGILERTDRVWTSDSNDPVDRQQIQLWTGLLLPPELIGAHVGPTRTHVTGRVTDLEIRCATALFGHAGIERDITECDADELSTLTGWIDLYKSTRDLLHTGTVVVPDIADPSAVVHGVVSPDRTRAMFSYAQISSAVGNTPLRRAPMRLRLPGLDPSAVYRVTVALGPHGTGHAVAPPEIDGARWTGRALETVGLPVSRLNPADAMVIELRS
ncbi:MAG TPA: alpha-galactosidase [Candidatus Limnocylindrales bacterium]